MKHTKGEWKVIKRDGFLLVANPGYDFICELNTENGTKNRPGDIDFSESEANAKLISASPELLECCNRFLRIVHHYGFEFKGDNPQTLTIPQGFAYELLDLFGQTKTATNKAEGVE